MSVTDPLDGNAVIAYFGNIERARVAITRYLRGNPDALPAFIDALVTTKPDLVLRMVRDLETGAEPVVRPRLTGATSPNRAMVAAHDELASTGTPSDQTGGAS